MENLTENPGRVSWIVREASWLRTDMFGIDEEEHRRLHQMEERMTPSERKLYFKRVMPTSWSTRGLKYLSIKVRDMVIKCGATTYQNVATELISGLKEESIMCGINPFDLKWSDIDKDEKNIRWRVYDALNVLIAAGVLKKNDRKEVTHNWLDPSKLIIMQQYSTLC
jgi:hypothetical protein